MMPSALWCALALAGTSASDVQRPIAADAAVNWTAGQVEITAFAIDPSLAPDPRPLEQLAIQRIEARLVDVLGRVPATAQLDLGELEGVDLARAARSWSISESRYFASGRVEVVGAISLREVLSPWIASRAPERPAELPEGPTGFVIDARGLPVKPSWAPRVVDADGRELYSGMPWKHRAWEVPPCWWITDPMLPEVAQAGAEPVLLLASAWKDGAIVLAGEDASIFERLLLGTAAAGNGGVVVVVDP